MKLNNKILLGCLIYLACIIAVSYSYTSTTEKELLAAKENEAANSLSGESEESAFENSLEKKKNKNKKKLKSKSREKEHLVPPLPVYYNTSLQNNTFRNLNYSFVKQDLDDFKDNNKRFNYKVLDKQLEDIFRSMNQNNADYNTIFSDRAYMAIFMNNFNLCDTNKDQVLSLTEFKGCMWMDDYLAQITPPNHQYANQQNYTDKDFFIGKIFDIMDPYHNGYMNFHGYMEFRLMIFSWRKCSVLGPFIEEINWECAIDVVSNMKTMSRSSLRNTYAMCLEISNSWSVRTIDFISYLYFATSARIYGRINGKGDGFITSKL